jgi:HK97 family phage prohead protease
MAKKMHPKILELRNKVGYKPIYEFVPNRAKYDALPLEQRKPAFEKEESSRLIKQYFAVWGVPDDYGTRPIKGCFAKSINERGPSTNATNKIVVLNQHNQREPLCLPTVLQEDEIGLYGEYEPDPDIEENDKLVKRVKRGTINGGSYGFHYIWDKMEWNEKDECIDMYETELFEVSPVTLASQGGTFVVRGKVFDEILEKETEEFIRTLPRKQQLELRSLLTRHMSLADLSQPLEDEPKSTAKRSKPKQRAVDYSFLTENL